MSHLYVYAPCSAVRDRAGFRRAVRWLQAQGHEVEIDPGVLSSHMRFAGDDSSRLAAIERAARSGADVALIARGGYGMTRLLHRMPWDALAGAAQRGMRWLGFSDFTALQCALYRQRSCVTWSGPALIEGFGAAEGPDEITALCFDDLCMGLTEGVGWRLPAADWRSAAALGQPLEERLTPLMEAHPGVLWGGNLALLCALLGTPWWPAIDDGYLVLEDVHEAPYRVERMLLQLAQAGVLERQRAVLLGSFTGCDPAPHDRGFNLKRVIEGLRGHCNTPILTGFPFGHTPRKVIWPFGQPVRFLLDGRHAILTW